MTKTNQLNKTPSLIFLLFFGLIALLFALQPLKDFITKNNQGTTKSQHTASASPPSSAESGLKTTSTDPLVKRDLIYFEKEFLVRYPDLEAKLKQQTVISITLKSDNIWLVDAIQSSCLDNSMICKEAPKNHYLVTDKYWVDMLGDLGDDCLIYPPALIGTAKEINSPNVQYTHLIHIWACGADNKHLSLYDLSQGKKVPLTSAVKLPSSVLLDGNLDVDIDQSSLSSSYIFLPSNPPIVKFSLTPFEGKTSTFGVNYKMGKVVSFSTQ
jgi:hypothetical protein